MSGGAWLSMEALGMDWLSICGLILLGVVTAGLLAIAVFVGGGYVLAMALTRGGFGWPGFAYFFTETLWMWLAQSLLPLGWLRAQVVTLPPAAVASQVGQGPLVPGGDSVERSAIRPIIAVHGYTQNRMNFLWLARKLRQRGLGPVYGFDYFSFNPIETSARSLEKFVEKVRARTGAEEVDLLCHSLGGLVARTYVDLLGGDRYVRCVVTLGTPHRGILHAHLGVGASTRDMHPRNGFIERLEQAPSPPTVRYLSIYSVHDNIVYPGHTASTLGGRGREVVVRNQGHFSILFSSEVAAHVCHALDDDSSVDGRMAA